jgi:hypothetical protein
MRISLISTVFLVLAGCVRIGYETEVQLKVNSLTQNWTLSTLQEAVEELGGHCYEFQAGKGCRLTDKGKGFSASVTFLNSDEPLKRFVILSSGQSLFGRLGEQALQKKDLPTVHVQLLDLTLMSVGVDQVARVDHRVSN